MTQYSLFCAENAIKLQPTNQPPNLCTPVQKQTLLPQYSELLKRLAYLSDNGY